MLLFSKTKFKSIKNEWHIYEKTSQPKSECESVWGPCKHCIYFSSSTQSLTGMLSGKSALDAAWIHCLFTHSRWNFLERISSRTESCNTASGWWQLPLTFPPNLFRQFPLEKKSLAMALSMSVHELLDYWLEKHRRMKPR